MSRKRMKRKLIGLALFLLSLVALAVTKPNRNHFQNWLNYHLAKPERNLLETAVKRSVGRQANYHIAYSDKIIFSVAETKIGNSKMKFLGVFNIWLPI